MTTIKTLEELRTIAQKALDLEYGAENKDSIIPDIHVQNMWMNGFMAGYLNCQIEELSQKLDSTSLVDR